MKTLLQIKTSVFSDHGNSTKLANEFVAGWQKANPDGRVVVRDLATEPLPHLSAERVQAFFTPAAQRTAEQQAHSSASEELIDELKAADVVVLGLPLYNFGVPSTLKAYFDHLARNGISFRYTANGPEGLIADRKVYVFAARGGFYKDTPADSQTPFVKAFLNFIGLRDIEFVYAEGLNVSEDQKRSSLEAASAEIVRLAA
ncbi:FMN-dependent NADH-azoreductase [Solimonas terrae]|uniref:FMN dependent NADH:quinone oxidoreductase n=1 Tax=Solimonas terrae TaxID=1396819 RepID=A0A6M2BRM8_9GAMM|nr:NAD(P)H-dependent oxidoreductase [Solimonas terrae]NGY05148.1 FMN-dependent NADH-azoreductase [Solimonas terrae]